MYSLARSANAMTSFMARPNSRFSYIWAMLSPASTKSCSMAGSAHSVLSLPPALATKLAVRDRKSTRLNSSHVRISYAVFCLKNKIKQLYKLGHGLPSIFAEYQHPPSSTLFPYTTLFRSWHDQIHASHTFGQCYHQHQQSLAAWQVRHIQCLVCHRL